MTDSLWHILLEIRNQVERSENEFHQLDAFPEGKISLSLGDNQSNTTPLFRILTERNPHRTTVHSFPVFQISRKGHLTPLNQPAEQSPILKELQVYLPLCLGSIWAKKEKRAYVIAHFAQSLDGYIATTNGHSQWIGNPENLVHAHRVRALVDGVIIGNNTLRDDKPKLTVRHVPGKNPQAIVVGNSGYCGASLASCRQEHFIRMVSDPSLVNKSDHNCKYLHIPCLNGHIPTRDITSSLYEQGIHSVLLEGGPKTSSNFLEEGNINIVQLHIAPMLLGSGKKNFSLKEVNSIDDGMQFKHHFYSNIGDAIMITGFL